MTKNRLYIAYAVQNLNLPQMWYSAALPKVAGASEVKGYELLVPVAAAVEPLQPLERAGGQLWCLCCYGK